MVGALRACLARAMRVKARSAHAGRRRPAHARCGTRRAARVPDAVRTPCARAGRLPCPWPRSDLSQRASLLTAFDGAALDSLVRDAPLARVGACEALSTTRAFHNKSFGAGRLDWRAATQASPDLIERADKALFAHPATVDALRTFFSCGGDGRRREARGTLK